MQMSRNYDIQEWNAVSMDYLNEISNGLLSVATYSRTAIFYIDTYTHGLNRGGQYFNQLDVFNFPMDLIVSYGKLRNI